MASASIGLDSDSLEAVPSEYVEMAHELADLSGNIVSVYYRKDVPMNVKLDTSPVTIADSLAEQAMREAIRLRFPHHGVFGEELGAEGLDREWCWVLDPIDGTKSFMTGMPLFGTLIALLYRGTPVLGVINQPVTRERWFGGRGLPTTWNNKRMSCRPCRRLNKAIFTTTSPDWYKGSGQEAALKKMRESARMTIYGGDCYAYGLLSSGFVDLVVEPNLKPWDYCALVPIVSSAGGLMTDWRGRELGLDSDGCVIAAGTPELHRQALELLNEAHLPPAAN